MSQPYDMNVDGNPIGYITLNEDPSQLAAFRTATGFNLIIPVRVTLRGAGEGKPMPLFGKLWGTLYTDDSSPSAATGSLIEVGHLRNDSWYQGFAAESSMTTHLTWSSSFQELAFYEKKRDGKTPKLKVNLHGEFCYLLPFGDSQYRIRTEPRPVMLDGGRNIEITFPVEVWVRCLRTLRVAETVLVEIPLSGTPPLDWDGIWQALVEARNAFEQGGSTGWKACVTAVRLALERWQGIEPEDKGPGWKPPSLTERESRTHRQRLDNVRWHLLQCAHKAPHSNADEWTRDDALLMLSTLSALLAERKP